MPFGPFVPAETLEACALIGLHLTAAGSESRSSSSCGVFSPELGEIPELSGPRYPLWKEEAYCSENDSTLSSEVYEHNSECRALEVIGQDCSSEVVAFLSKDWELEREALSCHMAMDLLCQEMRDAGWDRSESLGSPCSMCLQCWEDSLAEEWKGREPGKSTVTASESLSLTVDGL